MHLSKLSHLEGLRHILKFISSDEEMSKRAAANAGLDISKSEELEGARQLLMNPDSVQMDAGNKDYFLRQALKLTEDTAPQRCLLLRNGEATEKILQVPQG
jgi:hypothetical protein